MKQRHGGFTIVELLIVIVVIAILAAITIIAFNGVKDRARWSKIGTDISSIRKGIEAYNSANGSYPSTGNAWRYSCQWTAVDDNFIPGVTAITPNLQQAPCTDANNQNNDTWLYRSDGVDYKLLYVRPANFAVLKSNVPASMQDSTRWSTNASFGYWTQNAAGW